MKNQDNTLDPTLDAALKKITEQALSKRARFAHIALLLVALAMSTVIGALIATEAALPIRTQFAFFTMLAISLCWTVYAVWVLRNRWTLLANHRIVAGRMAVAFSMAFMLFAFFAAIFSGAMAAWLAAGTGMVFVSVAVVILLRAHRLRANMLERCEVLKRQLQGEQA
ncbi:MAG: hypothetical protein ABI644_02520 [Arenimonas sp.]